MKYNDIISSIFWAGMGILFCVTAHKYGVNFSARGVPGSGFFPFVVGISLISLSLILFFSTIRQTKKENSIREKFFPQSDSWKKVLLALFALFGYAVALEYLGFLVTTFLFMGFLLRFIEVQRWRIILVAALAAPVLAYAIFDLWLGIRLPKGILGI